MCRQIIVTGTGRCGTGYIAQVLTSAGVKCTHEGVFVRDGLAHAQTALATRKANPDWGWEAESSWMAAPFLSAFADDTIVHLVRHPLLTMASMVRTGGFVGPFYDFQCQYLPELVDWDSLLDKAACLYLGWNRMIEPHADVFHRVEDNPVMLLHRLGVGWEGKELFSDDMYNTGAGVFPGVCLDDVSEPLRERLCLIAARYGYDARIAPGWAGDRRTMTFAGVPIQQSWADLAVWEKFFNAHRDIKTIVELGTYRGGFSVYLKLQSERLRADFWTFDVGLYPSSWAGKFVELESRFVQGDIFADERLPEILADSERPLLLFCDDGNKPKEFATFIPMLHFGDYVAVHDWGHEIFSKDIELHQDMIESLLWQTCEQLGSTVRFWEVKSG